MSERSGGYPAANGVVCKALLKKGKTARGMMTMRATISQASTSGSAPAWVAEDLTQGGQLAQIRLGEQEYFLRITRAGKLILTK